VPETNDGNRCALSLEWDAPGGPHLLIEDSSFSLGKPKPKEISQIRLVSATLENSKEYEREFTIKAKIEKGKASIPSGLSLFIM
jgi:hypothetical protein